MAPHSTSVETASTLVIGAVGIALPEILQSWTTLVISILSGFWVAYQIVARIRTDLKKFNRIRKKNRKT